MVLSWQGGNFLINKEELTDIIISEFSGENELVDILKFLDKSKSKNSKE